MDVNEQIDSSCHNVNSAPCTSLLAVGYMFCLYYGNWTPRKDSAERSWHLSSLSALNLVIWLVLDRYLSFLYSTHKRLFVVKLRTGLSRRNIIKTQEAHSWIFMIETLWLQHWKGIIAAKPFIPIGVMWFLHYHSLKNSRENGKFV